MNKLTEDTAVKMFESVKNNGGEPLHFYTSNSKQAEIFKQIYPHIEVVMTPTSYLPTDTTAVLTQEKLR